MLGTLLKALGIGNGAASAAPATGEAPAAAPRVINLEELKAKAEGVRAELTKLSAAQKPAAELTKPGEVQSAMEAFAKIAEEKIQELTKPVTEPINEIVKPIIVMVNGFMKSLHERGTELQKAETVAQMAKGSTTADESANAQVDPEIAKMLESLMGSISTEDLKGTPDAATTQALKDATTSTTTADQNAKPEEDAMSQMFAQLLSDPKMLAALMGSPEEAPKTEAPTPKPEAQGQPAAVDLDAIMKLIGGAPGTTAA